MKLDIEKYEKILDDTELVLSCDTLTQGNMEIGDVNKLGKFNQCLSQFYESKLKGKYTTEEIKSILGIAKILMSHIDTLPEPSIVSYAQLATFLNKLMFK